MSSGHEAPGEGVLTEPKPKLQSIWVHFLPDIAEIVMEYLDEIDTCGYLNAICKEWTIKATERTYSRLCHRVYLQQTLRGVLNVQHWGGLWRTMLANRPRLRTNGIYWLRTSRWKKPHNDMFWEEKISQFIECIHFRHIRFFNDGRLLYVLNNKWPVDSAPLFQGGVPVQKKVFPGVYTLVKNEVRVEIYTHYKTVIRFHFLLQDLNAEEEGGYAEQYKGKFNVLKMTAHKSVPVDDEGNVHPPHHNIPEIMHKLPEYCNFKFYRVHSWGN